MSREKSWEQMTLEELYPDLWCGKTCQEHSVVTTERTSEQCLKKLQELRIKPPQFLDLRRKKENSNGVQADVSWVMGGPLLGEYTMRSFGEFPSEERESHLSQILQGGGAPEILFERESLPRNTEQSETEREEVTGTIGTGIDKAITFQERGGGRPGGGKGILIQNDRTGALSTVNNQMVFDASRRHDYQQFEDVCETVQAHYGSGGGHVYEDKAGTVRANAGDNQQAVVVSDDCYAIQGNCIDRADTAGCNGKGWRKDKGYTLNTMDRHAVVYGISSYNSNAMKSDNPNSGIYEAETARTLDLNGGNPACNQGGMAVCVGNGQLAQAKLSEKVGTLNCMHDQQAVLINTKTYQDVTGTLDCCIAKGTSNQLANQNMFVANTSVVRRLTPLEVERLQGFPDLWTDIGEWVDTNGKKHKAADSPRYKALGNSIALPFWQWMAERMVRLIKNDEPEKEPTMASLFDGIGGFPLVYSRCGCKPVFSSEIEEFPIAVVKKHFGDDDLGIKGDYERYL